MSREETVEALGLFIQLMETRPGAVRWETKAGGGTVFVGDVPLKPVFMTPGLVLPVLGRSYAPIGDFSGLVGIPSRAQYLPLMEALEELAGKGAPISLKKMPYDFFEPAYAGIGSCRMRRRVLTAGIIAEKQMKQLREELFNIRIVESPGTSWSFDPRRRCWIRIEIDREVLREALAPFGAKIETGPPVFIGTMSGNNGFRSGPLLATVVRGEGKIL